MTVAPTSSIMNALSAFLGQKVNPEPSSFPPPKPSETEVAAAARREPAPQAQFQFDPTAPIPEGPARRGQLVDILA